MTVARFKTGSQPFRPSCRKSPGATSEADSRLPLVLPSATAPGSLQVAICQVKEAWQDQPSYAEQTLERYGALLDRFARHSQAMGLSALSEVDQAAVAAFAAALGRDRHGRVMKPSARTIDQRRAAVAAFFSTAMTQGLTLDDPTPLVPGAEREKSPGARPLDPAEAVDVRFHAGTNPAEVRGVVVSLLLSGARTGELGALEIAHMESAHAVRLPGSAHFSPRTISVDSETAGLLAARAAYLAKHRPQVSMLCGKAGKPSSQQSRIATVVRKVLKSAKLGEDPRVVPTSLTAYAARQEFQRTGSVEAAAALIGSKSLDSTARLIGHSWIEVSI